ncbi:hypothetical protein BU23DRAFT_603751 [Bimuria novae-zelandiae CBS 107.79]|uniref:Uncharacterized protein n=1 Tax=Bimuria novae-zelandiae CBS 107.79 TaxID=1447943 RepID=A0A6A5UQZ1_9PLEO|nr:hypothetical protein BU23DRAFT_603751 [Bimuria novae-zelandiae CBS 107.79]
MSKKTSLPADVRCNNGPSPAMSFPRALLTLAVFLALPLGLVYLMSHCSYSASSTTSLTLYRTGYRHPHATTQAKQSTLDNIGKLMAEASSSRPNPNMQMRFCAGEDLRGCTAYPYDKGCTKIDDMRILSIAEPSMFEGVYSACTVYRRGVENCAMDQEGSFQHVKDFVVNWYLPNDDEEYAAHGVVPLLQKEWISDIGSFKCR